VDRVIARERADAGFGWIVTAAREHGRNGIQHGRAWRQTPAQARAHFGEIRFAGRKKVGADLQVSRIFCRLPIHQPRMSGADKVTFAIARDFLNERLHRLGKLVEAESVFDEVMRDISPQRLVVGKEIIRAGKVAFRHLVVAAMYRVIGPLKQSGLGVLDEF
jgi:hypothetical protein